MLKLLRKLFKTDKTSDIKEGKVKFFNFSKGFGFITINGTNEEIFVHKTKLKSRIKEGNHVTFQIEQSDKGPVAVNVKKQVKK